jgi:hypothetical protein
MLRFSIGCLPTYCNSDCGLMSEQHEVIGLLRLHFAFQGQGERINLEKTRIGNRYFLCEWHILSWFHLFMRQRFS